MLGILWLVGFTSRFEFVVLCCAGDQTHNLVYTLLLSNTSNLKHLFRFQYVEFEEITGSKYNATFKDTAVK